MHLLQQSNEILFTNVIGYTIDGAEVMSKILNIWILLYRFGHELVMFQFLWTIRLNACGRFLYRGKWLLGVHYVSYDEARWDRMWRGFTNTGKTRHYMFITTNGATIYGQLTSYRTLQIWIVFSHTIYAPMLFAPWFYFGLKFKWCYDIKPNDDCPIGPNLHPHTNHNFVKHFYHCVGLSSYILIIVLLHQRKLPSLFAST